jgi:glycosyltransferase involved in cell wall biosynthesis
MPSTPPPKVSIIIPTYNGGSYLELLIDSILNQSFSDFEVLLLDDSSKDDSWDTMKRYESDPRFRLFRWNPNRGAHAGTFFLLGQMRGEFWCYPGADDILHPDFIQERLNVIESSPNCALVHGRADYIDQDGKPAKPQTPDMDIPSMMPGARALETLLQHNYINAPSVMVRTSVTRLVLPQFCGMMFYPMDWYLWLLIAATGFDFAWDENKRHSYRVHLSSNSLIPAKEAIRKVEIRLTLLLAMKKACGYSDLAMDLWARYGRELYLLTLFRCWNARKADSYRSIWIRQAMVAAGRNANRGLTREYLSNLPAVLWVGLKEKKAKAQQAYTVSGLAQIDEPLFRRRA